jgi:hypothetical protein
MSCVEHLHVFEELFPVACSDATEILFGVSNITAYLVLKLNRPISP